MEDEGSERFTIMYFNTIFYHQKPSFEFSNDSQEAQVSNYCQNTRQVS